MINENMIAGVAAMAKRVQGASPEEPMVAALEAGVLDIHDLVVGIASAMPAGVPQTKPTSVNTF